MGWKSNQVQRLSVGLLTLFMASLDASQNSVNQSIKKQKIVFTNGCFDIIHYGHIKYLEKAKNLGDLLIVGINTDSSVSSLKGKSRPINNLLARVEILKSLNLRRTYFL